MDDIAMMYDVFSIKKYQIPYRSMNISYQNWVFKKHHLGLAAMVEGYLKLPYRPITPLTSYNG